MRDMQWRHSARRARFKKMEGKRLLYFLTLAQNGENSPSGDALAQKKRAVLLVCALDMRCEPVFKKGRRRLKGKDIIKGVSVSTGEIPEHVKESMRAMIDAGRLMYCDSVGATSVEIPSEEYLREKGIIK